MKQITQTEQLNLIVTRDGTIDQEYARKQQLQRIGNTITHTAVAFTEAASQPFKNFSHNVATVAKLAVHDRFNGTDYASQWFEDARSEREAAFKAKFKLV